MEFYDDAYNVLTFQGDGIVSASRTWFFDRITEFSGGIRFNPDIFEYLGSSGTDGICTFGQPGPDSITLFKLRGGSPGHCAQSFSLVPNAGYQGCLIKIWSSTATKNYLYIGAVERQARIAVQRAGAWDLPMLSFMMGDDEVIRIDTDSITKFYHQTVPQIWYRELDETLPAGLWRFRLEGNILNIDCNLASAGNFSAYLNALALDSNGNVMINTALPTSKLAVGIGDIETQEAAKGIIVRTPDGTARYRIRVDNLGVVVTEVVA
jgi:hypothetical protein